MMRGSLAAIPLLLAVLAAGDRSELGDQSEPRPRVHNPESDIHDLQSPIPKNVQWFDPTATELSDGGVLNDAVKNVKKASEVLKGLSGAVYDRIDEHRQNVEGVRDSMDKRDALINTLDAQILGQLTDSDSSRMKAVNDATAGILPPVGDEDEDEGDIEDLAEGGEDEAGGNMKAHEENHVSDFDPFHKDESDAAALRRSRHGSKGDNVGSARSSGTSGKIPVGDDETSDRFFSVPESVGRGRKAASNTASRPSSSRSSRGNYSQGFGVSSKGWFTGKPSVPEKSRVMERWEREPLREDLEEPVKGKTRSHVARNRGAAQKWQDEPPPKYSELSSPVGAADRSLGRRDYKKSDSFKTSRQHVEERTPAIILRERKQQEYQDRVNEEAARKRIAATIKRHNAEAVPSKFRSRGSPEPLNFGRSASKKATQPLSAFEGRLRNRGAPDAPKPWEKTSSGPRKFHSTASNEDYDSDALSD